MMQIRRADVIYDKEPLMALMAAILLGLRHATDPDHLTAVATLFLSDQRSGTRRAAELGLAWGLGHAATLFVFGIPVVLFSRYLPDSIQRAAEAAIGFVIVALAVRLLLRWHRGYFHVHPHSHGPVRHAHPHAHEHGPGGLEHPMHHTHPHADGLGRSPLTAFGIGMVHGIGGSAGVGILLVGAVSGRSRAAVALLMFAGATAVSMALVSSAFAYALASGAIRRGLTELVPVFGTASLLFGVWYSIASLYNG
jgi:ABC-type nickel/cobalt efflux system permease component RcnA